MTYTGETNARGEPHGQGVSNWANGDRFEGQWKDGVRTGQGVYNWANGDRYEGQWKGNQMHGQGVMIYAAGGRYEGQWRWSMRTGQGVMIYADGTRYEGWWENDQTSGKGTMTWTDGSRYEGEWEAGMQVDPSSQRVTPSEPPEDEWFDEVHKEVPVYSKRVHSVTQRFHKKLAEFDENIRNGETFSFAFDAHIEDEDTLHLFIASVREILEENGLSERSMFEHDGFLDRDANADAERDYANVTEIRYLLLSDSNFLECPCCESSKDVHTIQVTDDAGGWRDMLRYKCMDVCDVSFRQTFGGDIVWDMAFPHCDTCGDSDDVYEDWENGICQAQDSENEHGCGPFYCSNCDGDNSDGHRISTDGGCVDTSCECDDWDD